MQRHPGLKSKYLFPAKTTNPQQAPEGLKFKNLQNIKAHKHEGRKNTHQKRARAISPNPVRALKTSCFNDSLINDSLINDSLLSPREV